MNDFEIINKLLVPKSVLDASIVGLRAAGSHGYECFALWLGTQHTSQFEVTEVLFPRQTGHKSPEGVCVSVDSDELHRINVYLYERQIALVAQLHTHPTEAYHSDTDDNYPIATKIGSFSIVIPDFALQGHEFQRWAIFRLIGTAQWTELADLEKRSLIEITDHEPSNIL